MRRLAHAMAERPEDTFKLGTELALGRCRLRGLVDRAGWGSILSNVSRHRSGGKLTIDGAGKDFTVAFRMREERRNIDRSAAKLQVKH